MTAPRPRTDVRATLLKTSDNILGRRKSDTGKDTSVGDSTQIMSRGYHQRHRDVTRSDLLMSGEGVLSGRMPDTRGPFSTLETTEAV